MYRINSEPEPVTNQLDHTQKKFFYKDVSTEVNRENTYLDELSSTVSARDIENTVVKQ